MAKLTKKVIVGMSGGIDSSMTLILLKKKGYEPIGVTLKLPIWQNPKNLLRENICCTKESINLASQICKKLSVPYYLYDARRDFYNIVVKYFIKELKSKRTPNPCMICNRYFKFKILLNLLKKFKAQYIATGHYAKVKYNPKTKEYELYRAKDKKKDQSYNLAFLSQKQLQKVIFPLGNYYKKDVYKIAEKEGWSVFYQKPQSQDFCFVSQKSLPLFIKKYLKPKEGLIIDKNNRILGKHFGLPLYTLGQRKGLNLANGPFYVCGFNWKKNFLIVTKNKKDLYQKEIIVSPVNFISPKKIKKPLKVRIKTRSQQRLTNATLLPLTNKKYKIIFRKPVFAPTPGQFAVFYQKDKCLGGGIIN